MVTDKKKIKVTSNIETQWSALGSWCQILSPYDTMYLGCACNDKQAPYLFTGSSQGANELDRATVLIVSRIQHKETDPSINKVKSQIELRVSWMLVH